MKTILLKLSGPLQAWGVESHFETRQTDNYPSKSAIIGLIAGAIGYRREEEKILELNKLDFAVRIDQKGVILKDFQTAKMYSEKGDLKRTYVTNRYYLQDAMFIVAISNEDENLMKNIYDSLKFPYFQPFLGKRSVESLKKLPWQAKKWYQKKYEKLSNQYFAEIYADAKLLPNKACHYRRDKVLSFSQKSRKYTFRAEAMEVLTFKIGEAKSDRNCEQAVDEHDIFGRLED